MATQTQDEDRLAELGYKQELVCLPNPVTRRRLSAELTSVSASGLEHAPQLRHLLLCHCR